MTAVPSIDDPAQFLNQILGQSSPDLLRELLEGFVNTILSAQADQVCGAPHGVRDEGRVNRRNGYRHRDLDTRLGTLDVAVPKLREGSFYPDWLLVRQRRSEQALVSVVATCYLLGVSTRRMDKLVKALGITGLSKSQVSVMAQELDQLVAEARGRMSADSGFALLTPAGRETFARYLDGAGRARQAQAFGLGIHVCYLIKSLWHFTIQRYRPKSL